MKKNAALERKHNAMIIINNPASPEKQAKLLETVLKVLPPDSKTNRLLRFGSRMKPRGNPENDIFKYRNSLPTIRRNYDDDDDDDEDDRTFQAKVTVHRTLS